MAKKVGNTYFFTGKGKSSGGGGGGGTSDAVQYIPQELTEPQQMQARKNQGLYYSEGTPAGTITWDGNTEGKENLDLGGIFAYKVANTPKDIPQDAFIGFTTTEQLETTPFAQIVDYGQTPGAEGKMLMGAISGGGVVIVADQFSMPAEGTTIEADGIYFTLNVRSFSYDAYDGEIHQIPAKYIPSTGLEYYEIEATTLNPQQLDSVELTGYNYQDIVDALEAGKILVLTLRYDYGGENPVYGKYIGGQPSRMYNPDSDYGMACVRFPAAYSYLDQTVSGHFNAAVVKDIVIYEDWSQGGDEPILMLGVENVTIV